MINVLILRTDETKLDKLDEGLSMSTSSNFRGRGNANLGGLSLSNSPG